MIDKCTLYFPVEKLPLKAVLPKARSNAGLFKPATWYEYESGGTVVRLELGQGNLSQHLRGFRSYVAQLPNSAAARARAQSLIAAAKAVAGVTLSPPASPQSQAFGSLVQLLERFGGFLFVADSIMLPDRTFLVGPLAEEEPGAETGEPEIREVDPEEVRHQASTEGVDPARVAMRERNYRLLAERGFRCARWLPLYRGEDLEDRLRPVDEIAARLLALKALFLWVATPEEIASADQIRAFVRRNGLERHLTGEENDVLALPRRKAQQRYEGSIGPRLENMWALAWILGFEPAPPFFQGPVQMEVGRSMLTEFLPDLGATLAEFVDHVTARTLGEVVELEDLYYCTHNAVRSAQTGSEAVPRSFHPLRDGGAVHERRHALTWALSPGTDWDDTDLST